MSRSLCFTTSLVLALAAFFSPANAQNTQSGETGERRTIAVSIVTSKGQLVIGLEPNNFRAKLDGRPVQVLSATYDPVQSRVVFLLDWSGSMQDVAGAEVIIARNLITRLNPDSPVAVQTFSEKALERSPFSTDRPAALTKLEGLRSPDQASAVPYGKTPLFDALLQAIQQLTPRQPGDAIVLISDGGDNASKERESMAMRDIPSSGVRIFTVMLSRASNYRGRSIEEAEGPVVMARLSEASSGYLITYELDDIDRLVLTGSAEMWKKAQRQRTALLAPLENMAREINVCYHLEIQLPEEIKKPRKFKLEVVDLVSGKVDHNLIVHYPNRIYPAPATQ